ncbi:Ribosomal L1 domain-containing protein [Habropoda laboriosa]|uniref:Ribosomal L1 domain-containing protein n=2 Tax=Habropoda laboriosa TaxID=597456 RepID=A0A0L7R2N4_9HYME|nr:Ribosomal L1 domain-containing protein [Habropoda laboriosa]
MVASQKVIKKHKESVKILRNLKKKQNVKLKSKIKLVKVSKKKLKQKGSTNLKTVQVNTSENENSLKDIKSISEKINKGIKKKTDSIKKKTDSIRKLTHRQSQKESTSESKSVLHTESKDHVDKKKLKNEASKQRFGKKCSTKVNTQNNKESTSHSNIILKTTKLQKQKKVTSDNDQINTDYLNLNDISREHILQCINAIFHLTEEQLSKNALFDDESQPMFMQVTCIKVPKTPQRCMRILLPYSLVSTKDEVALFVCDLQRGRRKDYEPTIEHYENLLHKHGCTRVKSIIPLNQVKTEYDQYELKRKLVGSYDYFLVDGKIAGHLSHLLGRDFYKKRKLPTSVKMHSKNLKSEVEYALRHTVMQVHSFGDTHVVQIGHTSMKKKEILENILATCNYLSKHYPGGWANIRSVRIKTTTSVALPIYTTLKNKSLVDVPVVQPKRPKAYKNVSGELTTRSGFTSVTVTPEGNIMVEKKEKIKK